MKTMKKFAGLLLALVMVMALAAPAMAAEDDYTITIQLPQGIDLTNGVTYTLTRIFNATTSGTANEDGEQPNISYTLVEGATNVPDGFKKLAGGYVGLENPDTPMTDEELVANLLKYIDENSNIPLPSTTVSVKKNADGGYTVSGAEYNPRDNTLTINVAPGYYYISTTSGSAVTVDSTTPHAKVDDKNSVPTLEKKIGTPGDLGADEAIYQVGDEVPFVITVTVGKGAQNYVLHDRMDNALELTGDIDVTVTRGGTTVEGITATPSLGTKEDGCTLEIPFEGDLQEGDVITVKYNAKVVSADLNSATKAAKNIAHLSYGDGQKTPDDEVKVYNAKVTVYKVDGSNNNEPLAGAEFILRNADGKYYQRDPETGEKFEVKWGPKENATKVKAVAVNGQYVAEFAGLGAGTYYLEEAVVPDGYNKADDLEFTIYDVDADKIPDEQGEERSWSTSDLQVTHTVINNKGAELPSTGGIGTTIFTVVGGVLMAGAAVLFIAKKRSRGN